MTKPPLLLAGHEGPGLLYGLLKPFQKHGVNMTRIESRPSSLGKWQYVFFVDIEGHYEDADIAAALKESGTDQQIVPRVGFVPPGRNDAGMNLTTEPAGSRSSSLSSSSLNGEIRPPGDKSISHRALILASLASGQSRIEGLLDSEDVRATANACRQLGMTSSPNKAKPC